MVENTLYKNSVVTEAGGYFPPGWELSSKSDYESSEAEEIPLGELSVAMYEDDEGSFFKKDLIGNRKLQIKLDDDEEIKGYGFNLSSGKWEVFSLTSNIVGNKAEVLVTGVLKYKNIDDDEDKYVYLYKYINGDTTYIDVYIAQDNYELSPYTVFGKPPAKKRYFVNNRRKFVNNRLSLKRRISKNYFKPYPTPLRANLGVLNETFDGVSPPEKRGKIKIIMSKNMSTDPELAKKIRKELPSNTGERNARNPTVGSGRKTYKTRKHKRTRRGRATPRKHRTTPRTRRR
jgi:hypothetical protein